MTLAQDFQALARDLIATYGKTATLSYPGASTYDPTTDTVTRPTTASTVIISPPKPVKSYTSAGVVRTGELECVLAGLAIAAIPAPGNTLAFDNKSFVLTAVDSIYSGDETTPALYRLTMRGGGQ